MKTILSPGAAFSVIPALLLCLVVSSCTDRSCMDRTTFSSLREKKSDQKIISELREKIDREMNKGESRREQKRILDWYEQLGERYLLTGSWNLAIEYLEKAVGAGRRTAGLHYSLGVAYANRGKDLGKSEDFTLAEHHYRRSLELDTTNNEAAYGLAMLLFFQNDRKDEALAFLEGYLAQNRKLYHARFGLARMYYEVKRPEQALAVYQELYGDLSKLPDGPLVREYKDTCRSNMTRISSELSRKR